VECREKIYQSFLKNFVDKIDAASNLSVYQKLALQNIFYGTSDLIVYRQLDEPFKTSME